jgi:predicted DNA-binding transcriptional regulator AlpA
MTLENPLRQFYRVEQVAELLQISLATTYRRIETAAFRACD